jgi:type II secretory ATPase GspE/PulE/Tfp pilus assembly ATPase PilB-like protein
MRAMPADVPAQPDARVAVDRLLADAVRIGASDIHLEPVAGAYEVRYRVDGLLGTVGRHDAATGRTLVGRLMVMARLLTYRVDVPQEGRVSIEGPSSDGGEVIRAELRLAVMPTTHGLRAAIRLPGDLARPRALGDLGLPPRVLDGLRRFAAADAAGMLVVTGPAGSGKTTTLYATLQHLVETSPGTSIVALEDPVERDLPGVTQIEVAPFGELTYERCLRSILRQDPQVLMLGEIRDAATASLALQAALSGHRLLCTLHAASPGGAIARLFEMGMEPYQLTSALFGVLAQRLLRKLAAAGGGASGTGGRPEGLPAAGGRYRGRTPVAELALMDAPLREAILRRADADALAALIARQPGYASMRESARALVDSGVTDAHEVGRVLGAGGAGSGV